MKNLFQEYGIELTKEQLAKMQQLLELFSEWNEKINLSAIKDQNEILSKHLLDSLLVLKFFDFSEGSILDLGTGGGFPTLPLAIVTGAKIHALDSVQKKLLAVEDMADQLGLNVHTLHGRAEDFAQNDLYRESFSFVVTRAVAPWPVLLELTLPFLKVGGRFIAYQGPKIIEDLEQYKDLEEKLGGKFIATHTCQLEDAERCFIEIEKVAPCPKQYPRKAGEPKRKPLSL